MTTVTITSKGQITIPVSIRNKLGVKVGDKVEFVEVDKGKFAIIPMTGSVTALKGILRKPRKRASIEAMNKAAKSSAAGTRKVST